MTATERDQLQQFLSALRQTRAEPKDPVADALIREAVHAQADAPYLLVQRAMGVGWALEAAQTRMALLEAQCAQLEAQSAQQLAQLAQLAERPTGPANAVPAPSGNGSWMSSAQAWGRGADTSAPPLPSPTSTASPAIRVAASTPPAARPAVMPAQAMAPAATSAWGGGMVAQIATTAAGVVAGGLLFQGVQSLMGQHKPTPTPEANAAPASGHGEDEALPGWVSPQAAADDAGDTAWDAGEDWA